MSKSIDEKVVSMQFDNSKFESNVQQSMSTLDKLKEALKFDKASEGLENVSRAASNIKMDGVSDACEVVSAKFSALQVAAITALANITNSAVDAGKKIVSALTIDGAKDGFTEYELKMGSVQTIMNSTGEPLSNVMNQLEELNKYADRTIYSFSDMTTNIGKFTNAGVKLEDAVAAIKGVSNEAAVSGANAEEASRAMYNFAQALSAGYVKLIDWKSIENANMATVEFKNELLDTALALGTVVKEGDLYRTTTENAKGKVSDLFDATHNFNDALNHQWMTTEVLTQTLAKYADENTELGKKAYAAAQDVKTFSMMMDTLKEAVGSGWAVTWEKFVGDFEQSKTIFTKITNNISEIITAQADARNKFVNEAFNEGNAGIIKSANDWTKLSQTVRNAGGDVGKFKDIIIDAARTHGVNIDDMIEEAGNFNDTLKDGWLNTDILKTAISNAQALGTLSPEFNSLSKAVSLTNQPFQKFINELDEVNGRTHLLNAFTNIFKTLSDIIKPVKEAFREIFPAKTGKDLRDALSNFEAFTEKLKISEEISGRIKTAFEGFFKVIQNGIKTVKSIVSAFSPLKDIFVILAENLLLGAESLGIFFNELSDGDEEVSVFQKVLSAIHDTLESFANNLQSYIDKASDALSTLKEKISQSWDTGALSIVASAIERIKEALNGFTEGASDGLQTFFNTLGKGVNGKGFGKVAEVLETFGNAISKVAKTLGQILKPLIERLKEFFTEFDLIDTMAVTAKAGGISAVVAFLVRMADNIGDLIGQIGSLVEFIKSGNPVSLVQDFITGITDVLGGIEDKFRSDVIANFALSVGILAGSIYVLSTIDAKAAKQSIGIITLLISELVGLSIALDKLTSKNLTQPASFIESLKGVFGQAKQVAMLLAVGSALQKIAAAILVLAGAMKIISTIPFPEMAASFIALSAMLWELVGVTKVLSSSEKEIVKGCGALMSLSTSIMILSLALKVIASINPDALLNSFLALTGLLFELTIFMQVLDGNKGVSGAASLIALSTGILILSAALKVLATIKVPDLIKGLVAIAVLLTELGVALTFMDASLPGAAALLIASGALLVLSGALKVLATIKFSSLVKGLIAIGALLVELAVGLTLMIAALPGAIALTVFAKGLAILTPVLAALALIPAKDIYKALGEIAVALLAFGVVGSILGVVSPLILLFSAALLTLGVALVAIGGGLALAGTGITTLATGLGLLSEISKEAVERIVETLQIILDGIIQLIPNMVAAFAEGFINICNVFTEGAPTIKEAIVSLFDILITVFGESIPKLTEAFTKMILAMIEQVGILAPKLAETFYQLIVEILRITSENIPDIIQAGVDIMIAFIEGIQSATNQLIDAAMEAIIAFINGLAESIEEHTPELIEAVNKLFNSIIDAMLLILFNGNPKLAKQAKELITNFKEGINEKVSDVVGAIGEMISKMITKISDKIEDIKEAGKNLIDGFINGIKDKFEAAKDAVRSLGDDSVSTLAKSIKAHSPSELTTNLGEFFGSGFINGVTDKVDSAKQAAKNLGNTAVNGLKTAINSISDMCDMDMNLNPVITPVVDLSDFRKGNSEINGITSNWDNLSVGVTRTLANDAMFDFNQNAIINNEMAIKNQNGLELFRSAVKKIETNNNDAKLDNILDIMTQFMPLIGQGQVVLDTGATVGALAPKMDMELGRRATMRGRYI